MTCLLCAIDASVFALALRGRPLAIPGMTHFQLALEKLEGLSRGQVDLTL